MCFNALPFFYPGLNKSKRSALPLQGVSKVLAQFSRVLLARFMDQLTWQDITNFSLVFVDYVFEIINVSFCFVGEWRVQVRNVPRF